jgi:hypothetical protein
LIVIPPREVSDPDRKIPRPQASQVGDGFAHEFEGAFALDDARLYDAMRFEDERFCGEKSSARIPIEPDHINSERVSGRRRRRSAAMRRYHQARHRWGNPKLPLAQAIPRIPR